MRKPKHILLIAALLLFALIFNTASPEVIAEEKGVKISEEDRDFYSRMFSDMISTVFIRQFRAPDQRASYSKRVLETLFDVLIPALVNRMVHS